MSTSTSISKRQSMHWQNFTIINITSRNRVTWYAVITTVPTNCAKLIITKAGIPLLNNAYGNPQLIHTYYVCNGQCYTVTSIMQERWNNFLTGVHMFRENICKFTCSLQYLCKVKNKFFKLTNNRQHSAWKLKCYNTVNTAEVVMLTLSRPVVSNGYASFFSVQGHIDPTHHF